MNQIPYTLSNDGNVESMTLFLSGVPRTINQTHPSFAEIKEGISTLSVREVRELLDMQKKVAKQLERFGNVIIEGNNVTYKGELVHSLLADRMIQMLEEGYNIAPWALFMENLMQNPAKHAVDELYLWLELSNMPITERGNFLAYKKVQDDYTSFHRNRDGSEFHNDIGTLCQMPRNQVDDNRNRTCSTGLHFCSWDYLGSYYGASGKVVIVEVNPAHVVSIPSDYNNAKGRAEAYLVVGEVPLEECEHAFPQPMVTYWDSPWITHEQTDDIDYSSIDEGWYDDYPDEDDVEEESYSLGFSYGECGHYVDVDDGFDAASVDYKDSFIDFNSFEEGYVDGDWKRRLDEETDNTQDEDAFNVGYDAGYDDCAHQRPFNSWVAYIGTEFEGVGDNFNAFCDGYDGGWSVAQTDLENVVEVDRELAEATRAGDVAGSDAAAFDEEMNIYSDYDNIECRAAYAEAYVKAYYGYSPVVDGANQLRQRFRDLM